MTGQTDLINLTFVEVLLIVAALFLSSKLNVFGTITCRGLCASDHFFGLLSLWIQPGGKAHPKANADVR